MASNWRILLDYLDTMYDSFDPERLLYIDKHMQMLYPGKYTIEEEYVLGSCQIILVPVFEDTAEETMWMLKYA